MPDSKKAAATALPCCRAGSSWFGLRQAWARKRQTPISQLLTPSNRRLLGPPARCGPNAACHGVNRRATIAQNQLHFPQQTAVIANQLVPAKAPICARLPDKYCVSPHPIHPIPHSASPSLIYNANHSNTFASLPTLACICHNELTSATSSSTQLNRRALPTCRVPLTVCSTRPSVLV